MKNFFSELDHVLEGLKMACVQGNLKEWFAQSNFAVPQLEKLGVIHVKVAPNNCHANLVS